MTATCQCDRFPGHPCERAITQEDLRCDLCGGRDPGGMRCFATDGIGGKLRHHVPMRITFGDVEVSDLVKEASVTPVPGAYDGYWSRWAQQVRP